jgi:hypothetical protein
MSTTATARQKRRVTEAWQTKPTDHPVVRLRPGELRRLFWRRHAQKFPADDIGRRDAMIVLDHLVQLPADAYRQAMIFLKRRCPWLPRVERAAAIERAFLRRKFWSKSALGDTLGLTWEEREDCEITTFRPAGASDADMADRRKMKEAARKREKRRRATLHPKQEPPLSTMRATVIAGMLRPGERCTVNAICEELKRIRQIRFAHLEGKALTTAVHNAIDHGIAQGLLLKDVEPGRRMPVAWVTKVGATP